MRRLLLTQNQMVEDAVDGLVRLYARDSPLLDAALLNAQLDARLLRCGEAAVFSLGELLEVQANIPQSRGPDYFTGEHTSMHVRTDSSIKRATSA